MFNFMFHRLVLSLPFFLVKAFKSIHFLVNIILDDLTNFDMQYFFIMFGIQVFSSKSNVHYNFSFTYKLSNIVFQVSKQVNFS